MKTLIFFLIVSFFTISLNAQDNMDRDRHLIEIKIPSTSIMDIESTNNSDIIFTPEAITEAGLGLDFNLSNNDLWINYSNISATSISKRKIEVTMVTKDLPEGMTLKVTVAKDAGFGKGAVGAPVSQLTLVEGTGAVTLIENIGSAFTGDGANKGHQLTYNLSYDAANFGSLSADLNISLTPIYTIKDQ